MEEKKSFGTKFNNWFKSVSDTNLLLIITIVVFVLMYLFAMIFLGESFLKTGTDYVTVATDTVNDDAAALHPEPPSNLQIPFIRLYNGRGVFVQCIDCYLQNGGDWYNL